MWSCSRLRARVSTCSTDSNIAEKFLSLRSRISKLNGTQTSSRQMALRGDRRPRAVRRGDGLQCVGSSGRKRERQPVLLRAEAGRVGRNRFYLHVVDDAVQLSTT